MIEGFVERRIASRISWPAIFAGTFVFLAIEVTFGTLGTAIFASAANPSSAHPVTGMSAGIGIWLVILTIIAMYFGGRAAGALSGVKDSHVGMYHGLVTLGLSIFTSVVITALMLGSTTAAPATAASAAGPATVGDVVATAGFWLFVALLLGMIAAGIGGSHAVRQNGLLTRNTGEPGEIRKVA